MRDLYMLPGGHPGQSGNERPCLETVSRPHESDQDYFARRAQEEREVAQSSPDSQSRSIHLELAERYRVLSASIGEAVDKLG